MKRDENLLLFILTILKYLTTPKVSILDSAVKENENKSFGFEERGISIKIALIAITTALYTALGYIFQPISFSVFQFRVAELIVGMCIIFPFEGLIGKVLGVFFVNLTSPLGPIDLISCIVNIPALCCIIILRNKMYLKYLGGLLYAIIISIYVAIILNIILSLPIIVNFFYVLVPEIILATLGILLFDTIKKRYNLGWYYHLIIEITEQIQKERKFFFISSLLNYALAGHKTSRDEIISMIINLKRKGLKVAAEVE